VALSAEDLESGYWRAYRDFYRWSNLLRGSRAHADWRRGVHHFAYAAGWKRLEPLWDLVIRARRLTTMRPVLERVLSTGRDRPAAPGPTSPAARTSDPLEQRGHADAAGTRDGRQAVAR
jgi:hypothetical protein